MDKNNLFILDIDNVLNTKNHLSQVQDDAGYETRLEFEDYFFEHTETFLEPERVHRLNRALDDLDPKPYIVLCSSWQTIGIGPVNDALKHHGFSHEIQERTHDYFLRKDSNRFEEVRGTIRSIDPNRLVILDDSSAYQSSDYRDDWCFEPHHVQPDDGLTTGHVESIKDLWTVDDFSYESPPIPTPPWNKEDDEE